MRRYSAILVVLLVCLLALGGVAAPAFANHGGDHPKGNACPEKSKNPSGDPNCGHAPPEEPPPPVCPEVSGPVSGIIIGVANDVPTPASGVLVNVACFLYDELGL